ncbi:MAG: 2-oxo-4-hydroxy-4-carboxy-5-ureidoimidazoline decarboxylase [Burkholderiaceae bacterium]
MPSISEPISATGDRPLDLETLNTLSLHQQAVGQLGGLYEHSDWIVEEALARRPFKSVAHFRQACRQVVDKASRDAQLALIRAHPELTGKAKIDPSLAQDSKNEQQAVGLDRCSPEEFESLTRLNAAYKEKFGWPFIVAVRGPRGLGLSRQAIIQALARRLNDPIDQERAECLHQIHRIAEMRLNERMGCAPTDGERVWDNCESLAKFSEEATCLTASYLSDAHRAAAQWLKNAFLEAGCREVAIDAVGNVVGRWGEPPYLLTGSHYDTVRNGGRYDGRLGIFVPLEVLRRRSQSLSFGVELVAFAEEEGVRYAATFLGSSALTGDFKESWLEAKDADGISMAQAMKTAGLATDFSAIQTLRRDPKDYLGFVEVHIEQGPVLASQGLPLGVVTSINGSLRYKVKLKGQASHAGTTPMGQRRDAAMVAAELMVYLERRALAQPALVGTVGQLQVPNGSMNVVPGACEFSLDLRAPSNEARDSLAHDVLQELQAIASRRAVDLEVTEVLRASAAPSDQALQALWEKGVEDIGLPVYRLPSGAGHDAMKMHDLLPQAMLFVRGENQGISHNPLESTTADDMQLAVEAFYAFCLRLAQTLQTSGLAGIASSPRSAAPNS